MVVNWRVRCGRIEGDGLILEYEQIKRGKKRVLISFKSEGASSSSNGAKIQAGVLDLEHAAGSFSLDQCSRMLPG